MEANYKGEYAKEEKMEYKLLIEERSTLMEIQKKLNQWKHNYHIKILAMVPFGPENSGISLLILRSLKGENHGA